MRFVPRWMHRLWAELLGFFWLPCPICGREFGGHEWRLIDGKSSSIHVDRARPSIGTAICPSCTSAGYGDWPRGFEASA